MTNKTKLLDVVSSRIRVAVFETGLPDSRFEEKAGFSKGLIAKYTSGTTLPQLDKLDTLCDMTGHTADWFLGRTLDK